MNNSIITPYDMLKEQEKIKRKMNEFIEIQKKNINTLAKTIAKLESNIELVNSVSMSNMLNTEKRIYDLINNILQINQLENTEKSVTLLVDDKDLILYDLKDNNTDIDKYIIDLYMNQQTPQMVIDIELIRIGGFIFEPMSNKINIYAYSKYNNKIYLLHEKSHKYDNRFLILSNPIQNYDDIKTDIILMPNTIPSIIDNLLKNKLI